jgi:catechol 2,3-dioxygenase-like lactoylglutathione lyase family enzyme
MKPLSPILWTKDLKQTVSFYESVLGFKAKSTFQNFVSLTRGSVEIMFIVPQYEPEEYQDPNSKEEFFPRPVLTGSIFIVTDQVDELWESLKDKVNVKTSIENRAYLMRDFSILDNNGYELVFGQDII